MNLAPIRSWSRERRKQANDMGPEATEELFDFFEGIKFGVGKDLRKLTLNHDRQHYIQGRF